MELVLERPLAVKEERRVESVGVEDGGERIGKFGSENRVPDRGNSLSSSSPDRKGSSIKKQASSVIANERSSMATSLLPFSSNNKGSVTISQEDQLESTKAEMGEVREENERLKTLLARIVKDYRSLQMHFFDVVQQEQPKNPLETPSTPHEVEEPELVSLSLGTSISGHKKEEKIMNTSSTRSKDSDQMEEGLTLGLDCKFEGSSNNGPSTTEPMSNASPDNSSEEPKEEEAGEPWPPSKALKNLRSGDDEVLQQSNVKKARVSVRARCDAPTMHDGCQWRKYGQKISKGNPCPRAYYRCTVAPACPVRKQVQRCAEDMSILITTYEGNHNHPLPISATAMASTTSAAASMLMSGSSASRPAVGSPSSTSATTGMMTTSAQLHGLNFSLSDNSSRLRPFYLPNPTISSTPSYPTITLDLTSPPPSTSQPFQLTKFSSNFSSIPRYSSSPSFNFSSSESTTTVPTSWANAYLNYGAQLPYNKTQIGSLGHGRQSQDPLYQSYLHKATLSAPTSNSSQNALTDTIAKAITSDPSFQSALAAAITSYVGANGAQGGGDQSSNHGLKWGEQFSSALTLQSYTAAPVSGNGCGSSFLTRTSSSGSSQQGKMMFLQPPLPISNSRSTSASPVDTRENMN